MKQFPTAPIPPSVFYGPTSEGFGYLSRRPNSTKPLIAAINGITTGGGLEIALNCDIVLASEKAKFGFIETKNGLVAIHGGKTSRWLCMNLQHLMFMSQLSQGFQERLDISLPPKPICWVAPLLHNKHETAINCKVLCIIL